MRKIEFAEPGTQEWLDWRAACDDAAKEMVRHVTDTGERPSIADQLYKSQKQFYADVNGPFQGKCAYCEQIIVSDQSGDMEHYRPKGGVQEEDWSVVKREDELGCQVKHPGYYWLAYDWRNLLLSCSACNRPSLGKEFGKWNRFPVEGVRAWAPGQEVNEIPVLLNPCIDDPADHLQFDTETGRLIGTTHRGRLTIEVFGLNLRSLPALRLKAYRDFKMKFNSIVAQQNDNWPDRLREARDEPLADFSSVIVRAFNDRKYEYIQGLEAA